MRNRLLEATVLVLSWTTAYVAVSYPAPPRSRRANEYYVFVDSRASAPVPLYTSGNEGTLPASLTQDLDYPIIHVAGRSPEDEATKTPFVTGVIIID